MFFQGVTRPVLLKVFGKIKPIILLQKKPRYQAVFKIPKKSWDVSEDLFLQLEEFTCFMYKPRGSHLTVDDLRYELVLKKCCVKKKTTESKEECRMVIPFTP